MIVRTCFDHMRNRRLLSLVVLGLLLSPLMFGAVFTLLPAFGWLPALGGNTWTFTYWQQLFAFPGIGESILVSLTSGLCATFLAFGMSMLFSAACYGRVFFSSSYGFLPPLLSVPHSAAALGLAFLVLPSGWFVRLLSPWPSGLSSPPDWITIQDPWGIALILGLAIRETPFLMLMTIAAVGQKNASQMRRISLSLGHGALSTWGRVILPQIYRQLRLPIFAVLVYGVSTADMAIILGPQTPPTLSNRLVVWFFDANLDHRFLASCAAIVQALIAALAIAIWWLGEKITAAILAPWLIGGRSRRSEKHRSDKASIVAASPLMLSCGLLFLGILGMAVWSFTKTWWFPNAWPQEAGLDAWNRHMPVLLQPFRQTFALAFITSCITLCVIVFCLQQSSAGGRLETETNTQSDPHVFALLYIPLLVPQSAFLFGAQVFLVFFNLDRGWLGLVWFHVVFALPYVYLCMHGPWKALDPRYLRTAACLGVSSVGRLCRVRLPLLLRPILIAWAIGFSVSLAQYLPTLFASGGSFQTLTTTAVSLSSGGDWRAIGVCVMLQILMPWTIFALALVAPMWIWRKRSGLV